MSLPRSLKIQNSRNFDVSESADGTHIKTRDFECGLQFCNVRILHQRTDDAPLNAPNFVAISECVCTVVLITTIVSSPMSPTTIRWQRPIPKCDNSVCAAARWVKHVTGKAAARNAKSRPSSASRHADFGTLGRCAVAPRREHKYFMTSLRSVVVVERKVRFEMALVVEWHIRYISVDFKDFLNVF